MKKFARFLGGALTLILISNSTSYAWGDLGHMMVAAVAYQKLTQQTKDRVDALLLLNPDREKWLALIPASASAAKRKMMIFMIAATWADRIKRNRDYHADWTHSGNRPPNNPSASRNTGYDDLAMHKYWHFIDLPFTQDHSELPAVPAPNVQTQIAVFREVLISNKPDALKSYDLSWLLHLMGDVHQPLHCATRVSAAKPEGDDGGNGVKIAPSSKLHSYWDGVIGG